MKYTLSTIFLLALILVGCNKRNMDEEYFAMKDDVLLLSDLCLEKPNLHIVRKFSNHGSINFHCTIRDEVKDQIISDASEKLQSKKYFLKKSDHEKLRWCKGDGTVIEVNFTQGISVLSYLNSMDCEKTAN
jgi:hypothetical protein